MADIVVGASLPKTGAFRYTSYVQYSRSYELWVSDVNAAGGILGRPVRLLWHDDESDPAKCAANYRRLIHEDRVDLLLGPCHSVLIEPAAPVAEEAHMLLPEGSGSVGTMFSQGRKYLFLCWGSDRDYMKSFFEFITDEKNQHRVTRIGVLGGQRPRGRGHMLGVRYHATRLGLDIVYDESVDGDYIDYKPVLKRAYEAGPQVLLWDLEYRREDSKGGIPAAFEAGFKGNQLWFSDNPSQRGKMPSGCWMRCTWLDIVPSKNSRGFVERFQEAYRVIPDYHSAGGYACGQVLKQVVEASGTLNNEVLRERMLMMEFDTVLGPLRFAEDGIPTMAFPVAQWQGDKVEIVYPERVKTAEPIFD